MDRDTALLRITDGLGFRSDLATKVILRMQETQRDLERGDTLPDFLIKEGQTLSLLQVGNSVALPDDFLRRSSLELRYTPADSTISKTVPWRNYDAAYQTFSDRDPTGPSVAVLRASTILFFPIADRDYTLTWDYYAKAALLTTNVENVWLANAPELIIGDAGLRMALDIRNKEAQGLFGAMYKEARRVWFNETVIREYDDGPLLLGANN